MVAGMLVVLAVIVLYIYLVVILSLHIWYGVTVDTVMSCDMWSCDVLCCDWYLICGDVAFVM